MELNRAVARDKPYKISTQKVINGDLRDFPLCGFTKDGKPAVLVNEAGSEPSSYRRVFIKKDPMNEKQMISANGETIEFESLSKSEFKLVIKEVSEKQTKSPCEGGAKVAAPLTLSAGAVKEAPPNKHPDKPIVPPLTLNGSKKIVLSPMPNMGAIKEIIKSKDKPTIIPLTKSSTPPLNSVTTTTTPTKPDLPKITIKTDGGVATAKLIGVIKNPDVLQQKMPALIYTSAKKPKAVVIASSSKPPQTVTSVKAQNTPTAKVINVHKKQTLTNVPPAVKTTTPTLAPVRTPTQSSFVTPTTSNKHTTVVEKTPNAPLVSLLKTPSSAAPSIKTTNTATATPVKPPELPVVTAINAQHSTYAKVSPLQFVLSNGQQLILTDDNFQLNELNPNGVVLYNEHSQKKLQNQATNTNNDSSEQSTSTQDLIANGHAHSQTETTMTHSKECQTECESNNRSATNSPFLMDDLLRFINDDTPMGDIYNTNQPVYSSYTNNNNAKMQFMNDLRQSVTFDVSGNLPIHVAVIKNNLKEVKRQCFLLHAIQRGVNIVNSNSLTPLQLAVMYDVDPQIVYILVDNGADISVIDAEGNTVIHLAVMNSQDVVLTYLMKVAILRSFNIDSYNYEGCTPLIISVSTEKHEIARILLEFGADPNIKDQKSGRTALFHAIENNDDIMVSLLLHYRADTRVRNYFGTSPHDAMYELDTIKNTIRLKILGKDVAMNRINKVEKRKRRIDGVNEDADSNQSTPKKTADLNSIMNIYPESNYEIIQ